MSTSPLDPFSGTWAFNPARSTLSTPAPRRWIQRIRVSDADVAVQEEILASDGSCRIVDIQARFDAQDYPVNGSPLADAIAYRRPDHFTIVGIGKRNGNVSLRETLEASPDGDILTLSYSIYAGTRELATGNAILERVREDLD